MQFTISGKHIEITEAIRAYAQEKTAKLPRYYDGVSQVEVVVDSSRGANKMIVEIIARGEHGVVFVATGTGEGAYPCIDGAVHKLEQQLRKKKAKERDDKHMGEGSSSAGSTQLA
ncbi:MAG: ribosome-associated translation inhibitor RaiA [Planctomycetes bacterium]|nr:ribosome-associated translation inhibitor RaiA [Planctomycetota bacterium]